MALIVSAASGNFNAGATWVGGAVPTVGDEARASTGHTVTITESVTCDEISNAGTGTFILNNGVTLSANVTHKSASLTVTLLTFSAPSPASATIVGNCTGGAANDGVAVANTSSGLLTITGNLTANFARAYGANNTGVGTINVTGNITGGPGTVAPYGVNNSSTGTIIVTGNVTAGASTTGIGIRNGAGGTLNVLGSVTAVNAAGISNATTGSVTINGSITASNTNHGLECINTIGANITLSGSLISAPNGLAATNCAKFLMNPTPSTAFVRFAKNGTTTYSDFYTADNNLGQAAPSNVRAGTVYANGNLTGTCAVPSPGSVSLGVPVDATTGTAVLTPEAVWSAATRTLTAGAGISASDVWAYNSRTLTSASGPSAIEIRQEMDSNSTKLANLDTPISSRLASASYTAPTTPPTASEIATAVEGSLLNEADGQAVLNAIVGAIGNTNLSEVSLVAAVRADLERTGGKLDSIPTTAAPSASAVASATRTELSTELSRIDQSISSRLASSSYTAPANSDITAIKAKTDNLPASPAATGDIPSANITAIKAKTDLLNTERLANVPTVNILGTLLAQANS